MLAAERRRRGCGGTVWLNHRDRSLWAESMTETKGPRKQEMKLIRTEKIFYGKKTKKSPREKKSETRRRTSPGSDLKADARR